MRKYLTICTFSILRKCLCFAGAAYLLAFFAWGALNLGNKLFGRCALTLWSSVVAFSALLTFARCGMHLAFAIGKTHWEEDSKTGQILMLLGFTAASNGWQYVLVCKSK